MLRKQCRKYATNNSSITYGLISILPNNTKQAQQQHHSRSECTLYVKGFLSNPLDTQDNSQLFFEDWRTSHLILCNSKQHLWNEKMFAWRWPAGSLWQFPSKEQFISNLSSSIPFVNNFAKQNMPPFIPVPIVTVQQFVC